MAYVQIRFIEHIYSMYVTTCFIGCAHMQRQCKELERDGLDLHTKEYTLKYLHPVGREYSVSGDDSWQM